MDNNYNKNPCGETITIDGGLCKLVSNFDGEISTEKKPFPYHQNGCLYVSLEAMKNSQPKSGVLFN